MFETFSQSKAASCPSEIHSSIPTDGAADPSRRGFLRAAAGRRTAVEPPVSAGPVAAEDDGKSWYIIHTYSGFENKVAESLRTRAEAFGFTDKLGQVLIPTEEVVEMRNGKKVTSKRLLYPGYVLVQMDNGRRRCGTTSRKRRALPASSVAAASPCR